MKKINFNIKDRKILTLSLCLILVSVFTLTVAYSALSAVLTINGNAKVNSANWDIYLDNPRVTGGSATTNIPIVNGVTATFNTTLNMPGDFYEFTVDVVNGGSIDALIENFVKTPDLTVEQAKFLKYEISYQNGEAITTRQTLSKGTTMPIKVRIEYRNDLVASDLPKGQVVLDLSLTLEYIQSDGTGTSVPNNGVGGSNISANGSLDDIGTVVTIGDQQFYTIGTEGDNVKLLSMYNLYVGGEYYNGSWTAYGDEATGKQDSNMLGRIKSGTTFKGTTAFSNDSTTYEGSIVEGYVNNYKMILEADYGVDVVEARLISYDELTDSETFACAEMLFCSDKYPWIYSTSYWSGSANATFSVWSVFRDDNFNNYGYSHAYSLGVRPVIIISKNYF